MSLKILALDTATEACSAAVLVGDEVIERFAVAPRRHAELILPMLEAVLAEAGLRPAQLDAVAFGRGPGSFTGVRIATGVAQGIACAADLPVAPVSTLAAIARQVIAGRGVKRVAAALDARMGELYWGLYQADDEGGVTALAAECVAPAESVPLPAGADWYGAGSGWAAYGSALRQRLAVVGSWDDCYPRAGDIGRLGALAWRRGQLLAAEAALPVYLRDNVAHPGPASGG
ncbi:MAG TPA: tRNA (adenosine(37)-N6)-threonylcarbamoyltransferase complex dimerization subunit type 1 TsaB [Candidatus Competibacteraceae bacterium]|nr:tRNA (adenosine(37)-N6)-threonylcarbamoyltransferase complex dimerization subunit type 1 TsaB [Candidatus Competibacteraceae bacterium]